MLKCANHWSVHDKVRLHESGFFDSSPVVGLCQKTKCRLPEQSSQAAESGHTPSPSAFVPGDAPDYNADDVVCKTIDKVSEAALPDLINSVHSIIHAYPSADASERGAIMGKMLSFTKNHLKAGSGSTRRRIAFARKQLNDRSTTHVDPLMGSKPRVVSDRALRSSRKFLRLGLTSKAAKVLGREESPETTLSFEGQLQQLRDKHPSDEADLEPIPVDSDLLWQATRRMCKGATPRSHRHDRRDCATDPL